MFLLSLIAVYLGLLPLYVLNGQFKLLLMNSQNEQPSVHELDRILPYGPNSQFQELQIGAVQTLLMQVK